MTNVLHEPIWLTQAAQEQLQAELDTITRDPARDSESEARMRDLQALLRRAEVGEKPDDGLVEAGMMITVVFEGDDAPTEFLLAQRTVAGNDPAVEIEIYTPGSPLGTSIAGLYPGDEFRYTAPSGTEVSGRILSATPFREE